MNLYAILAILSPIVSVIAIILLVSVIWPPNAPWVPTPRRKARRMLDMAGVQPGEVVYDLGSGDGRTLLIAAREFGAQAVGIEIDPLRYAFSRALVWAYRLDGQVEIVRGDFFKLDLREADVVTCYLLQKTNEQLMGKLERELRPGTRVVSHAFTFPAWALAGEDQKDKLYLYRMGAKPDTPS